MVLKKHNIISIVGMAKNAGKTVTLNHLICEAMDEGIIFGITSTGRDGESQDIVTNTEKPLIYVPEGTFIATASDCLSNGDAKVEILKITDYTTPLGVVVLGKVREAGYIQITGPQRIKEIKMVCDEMVGLGAQLVIIDGAIDRLSSASPYISDGTILATGAVISRDMNRVIESTIHTIELFNLPEIKDVKLRKIATDIIENEKIAIINGDYSIKYINTRTALNGGGLIGENIRSNSLCVVFPGALVMKTLEDIIKSTNLYKNVNLIVRDGTRVFIDSKDWIRFKRQGIEVEVLNKIKVLAVTLNPYSPQGYYFEPREFLDKMKKYLVDIPVFDVMLGGE